MDERNSNSLTSNSLGLYAGSSLPLSASSITSVGEAMVVADASALLNTNESPGVEIETLDVEAAETWSTNMTSPGIKLVTPPVQGAPRR